MALTNKQQVFVSEYLQCWNAAEAARRAGYSENTARKIGQENLTKPDIAAEIQARLTEVHMSADEALSILADMARSDLGGAVDEYGAVDMVKLKASGKSHLVKSYATSPKGDRIEFYDRQAAIDKILRVAGKYVDRTVVTDADGGPLRVLIEYADRKADTPQST